MGPLLVVLFAVAAGVISVTSGCGLANTHRYRLEVFD
jgi:hypothetical protein